MGLMNIRSQDQKVLVTLALAGVFAFIIQLFFISPQIMSDDMEYYFWATKFPRMPEIPSHWSLRIGLLLPVSLLYRIFGHAELVYYTVPFISIILLAVSTCWLGIRLFSRPVGLFGALSVITIPNLLTESSLLLPDIPATACITTGFGILAALAPESTTAQVKPKASSFWWCFLAGGFFGWAYLVKEYYILFALIIPAAFVIFDLPWKRLIPLAGGMAAAFSIEAFLGLMFYENPFIRLMTTQPRETEGFIERDMWRVLTYLPTLLKQRGGYGPFSLAIIGAAAMLTGIYKKQKEMTFLAVWFFVIFFIITLIGLMPVLFNWQEETLLRLHKFRYWTLILPPLFIAGTAGLKAALVWMMKRFDATMQKSRGTVFVILAVLLIIYASVSLRGVWNFPNLLRNGADHYIELRSFLTREADSEKLIWINRDIKVSFERILPIFRNNFWGNPVWSAQIKYLNTDGQYLREDEITSGWVLVDRYFFKTKFQPIPDYLEDPPSDWRLIFESENKDIAVFAAQ